MQLIVFMSHNGLTTLPPTSTNPKISLESFLIILLIKEIL